MVSPTLIINGSISGFVGMVLGMMISLIVNCTLVEVSISAFFSFYFGILFIVVGCIIMWRIFGQEPSEGAEDVKKTLLAVFGMLIIFSGLLCFTLEQHWYKGCSVLFKVPLYMMLGTSVAFAFSFSVVDLVNYVLGFLQVSVAKPLVESTAQVHMVLAASLAMGAICGFVFGVMDVEDELSYQIRLALMREEHYCYPLGALLGGAVGFGNEYVREIEEHNGGCSVPRGYDEDI